MYLSLANFAGGFAVRLHPDPHFLWDLRNGRRAAAANLDKTREGKESGKRFDAKRSQDRIEAESKQNRPFLPIVPSFSLFRRFEVRLPRDARIFTDTSKISRAYTGA